jgi:hypothetical protein
MPSENELDIELPSIFTRRALTSPDPLWATSGGWRAEEFAEVQAASTRLVAQCGQRFYSDVGVPLRPIFPYIVWSDVTDKGGCVTHQLPRDFTGKKRAILTVRRVDFFQSGAGSYNGARATYNDIRRCLCGVGATPVRAQNGALLGQITQTRWFDDHKTSYRDADDLVTELGLRVEVTYDDASA